MSLFDTVNILDLMDLVGENVVRDTLSDFSCAKNKEIEDFVQNNAIEFSKKKMSITYLVFDKESNLVAIFTLTHKVVEISNNGLSRTTQKKMLRFARLDDKAKSYQLSAFLIAQFGKNSNYDGVPIEGSYLMQLALEALFDIQRRIGGGVVYLEYEDKKPLLDFYQKEKNGYTIFGERYSQVDDIKYKQLFKLIC